MAFDVRYDEIALIAFAVQACGNIPPLRSGYFRMFRHPVPAVLQCQTDVSG
jgi:hypothetical protein